MPSTKKGDCIMSKSNKELAVDVAIAYIHAHQKQMVVSSNNVIKETQMLHLTAVNDIIKSVYKTLEDLDQSSN